MPRLDAKSATVLGERAVWARGTAVAHSLHTGGVTGSIPVAPTIFSRRRRRVRELSNTRRHRVPRALYSAGNGPRPTPPAAHRHRPHLWRRAAAGGRGARRGRRRAR